MPSEAQSLLKSTTEDKAAQAVQALFQFLGLADVQAVQSRLHQKTAEAMNTEELRHQLAQVYQAYNSHVAVQGMDTADFLHLLADCQLLTNRFGLLEGQEVYQAAWAATTAASHHKALGLSEDGLQDALRRMAAVKLSKLFNLDEAFRRLLCHWVLPHAQQGPSSSPFQGLFTPVSMDLLARHDVILKKVFAWYASLPSLAGQASWEQFRHTQKGMLAGHLILLLTDFKVIPGMLSVRQVTGLLQQYSAEAPAQDGVLQYPHLLDMLSRCAVLLRQQVQRKLSGPWVNITELNSLKRYLKLQSLPSIQEAYALPDSPHHGSRLGSRVGKSGWDATGVETQMMSSLSSSVGSEEEEWYWREQDRLLLEAQQQEARRKHLSLREGDKRRLLQHRQERLSYDPRMPARLASFPCHMACTPTPPYALLDPAAPTPTTALNMDGDGWCPMVDVVRLECPSPVSSTEAEEDVVEQTRLGELPMLSLKHVPLEMLSTGMSKLGKRSCEMAWAHDTCDQLAAFDGRLPSLLAGWSIEKESQQWAQAIKDVDALSTVPSACCNQ
ncbi:hypothetical protein WJX82_003339 [Trebouxia sp. C0006]